MREAKDDGGELLYREQEDRQCQDCIEDPGSDIHYSSRNTNKEGNEGEDDDNKELQPAKQQK
jgi:hypothetical protein